MFGFTIDSASIGTQPAFVNQPRGLGASAPGRDNPTPLWVRQIMNTTFLHTTLSMTLLVAANLAFADQHRGQSLEDKADSALALSRDIRAEIRNDFIESTSFRHLLNDSSEIHASVRAIVESIHCNKPVDVICHQIRQTQRELHELSACLDASDFATVRTVRHSTGFRSGGYARREMGRHPGYIHYQATVSMIHDLEATLDCLHDDLPRFRPSRIHPSTRPVPAPHGQWNGRRGIGNSWTVPSASQPRPTFSTSVNLGSRGGLVFRVPLD